EARITVKLAQMLERLQEGILHHVLGVFAVLGDVLRQVEDLGLVAVHQLFKSRDVARLGGSHQDRFVVLGDCARDRFGIGRVQRVSSVWPSSTLMPERLERITQACIERLAAVVIWRWDAGGPGEAEQPPGWTSPAS